MLILESVPARPPPAVKPPAPADLTAAFSSSLFQHNTIVANLRAMVSPASFLSPKPRSSAPLPSPAETPPTTQSPAETVVDPNLTAAKEAPEEALMCPPPPTAVSKPRRRRAARIFRPAEGSIYDVLHEHAGSSLFVRPICWTDKHAELLGATFHQLPRCDSPSPLNVPESPPRPTKGHMEPSQTITSLSNSLTEILTPGSPHPVMTSSFIKTILTTLWPTAFRKPVFLPELHLFFGDRVYRDTVRTQVMWNFPAESARSSQSSFKTISTRPADSYGPSTPTAHNPAGLPMMCYISRNQLAVVRRTLFRIAPGPGRSWNAPVFRLQQARSRLLIPADPDHDVQFVAIFLAMAQRHFYNAPPPSSRRDSQWSPAPSKTNLPCPQFEDIKLHILTHDVDEAEFIVYTGHVTAKFLERFHDPLKAPRDETGRVPGLKIEFMRVPIWPILGLRERLGKALGEGIVGSFDPTEMETWETPADTDLLSGGADGRESQSNGKRKREALSEVFNASFDEESDADEDEDVGVKKRCLEGSPLSVMV
ncbi:fungal specific transcription factor domain-containing protein [Purpureocillium lavendulum]|uniref:Fungal specific transcription factor domain-containing protein n=1 Tax=Purpureocillium lavendulum TaxID=1247861 RepID=A0AB34FM58_9HYPO|nr:fungal specific transcription factor domain-containing protein [Purpureocillium lavendulum]